MFLVIACCKVEETVCLKKSDANEIFYSVLTLIGEKQEMHYHRYLSLYSLVVVAPSLTHFCINSNFAFLSLLGSMTE